MDVIFGVSKNLFQNGLVLTKIHSHIFREDKKSFAPRR